MPTDKIIYSNLQSPLGEMIGGATDEGICFLEWHDRGGVERVLSRVRKRYKKDLVQGISGHLLKLQSQLDDYFYRSLKQFSVRIDVSGTAFEMDVWNQLEKIPYGETRSYGEIAHKIGKPGASRAVGRANGANYLSILIPCHRVIESSGNLRGYGGGLWRKKQLLELESSSFSGHKGLTPIRSYNT